jgi:hypothetical protein
MTRRLPDFLLQFCQLFLAHKVHFVNDDQIRQSHLPAKQEDNKLLAKKIS